MIQETSTRAPTAPGSGSHLCSARAQRGRAADSQLRTDACLELRSEPGFDRKKHEIQQQKPTSWQLPTTRIFSLKVQNDGFKASACENPLRSEPVGQFSDLVPAESTSDWNHQPIFDHQPNIDTQTSHRGLREQMTRWRLKLEFAAPE